MDRVRENNGAAELGIDTIDRIDLGAIASSLSISKQVVRRRWRDSIPEDRQGDIRRLLETLPEQVSAVARVAEVSDLDRWVPPAQQSAIGRSEWYGDCRSTETSREARDIDNRCSARLQKDVPR